MDHTCLWPVEFLWFIIWVLIYNVEASLNATIELVQSYFKDIRYIQPPLPSREISFSLNFYMYFCLYFCPGVFLHFLSKLAYPVTRDPDPCPYLQTPPFFNHFIVRFHCLVSKLLSMTKAEPYSCLLLLSEYRWITISPYRITTVGSCVLELVWKVTQVRNQSGHRWNSKYNANTKDKYKYELLLKL